MRVWSLLAAAAAMAAAPCPASALDNGLIVPPMGWSSWYGFTQNINETMLKEMADGMVESGLSKVGFRHIWIDDGWVLGREAGTSKPIVDAKLFPSGMKSVADYVHSKGLLFGIYTSKGPKTCLGYQPTQPNRTGSCGFEAVDANTYVHDWGVDAVKDDGCGMCPQHDPFVAMRDALNATGKAVWFAIHGSTKPGSDFGTVANMWRTGGDLSGSNFDMWTNRLDLATADDQAALAGPGSFPNPDFLEVGGSPRTKHQRQSAVEERSMFTMWAALPGPLILSADLRTASSGIDASALATLTNKEVIAVNQCPLARPLRPVTRANGHEIWQKATSLGGRAVVFFYRNSTNSSSSPNSSSTGATGSGSSGRGSQQPAAQAAPAAGDRVTLQPCASSPAAKSAWTLACSPLPSQVTPSPASSSAAASGKLPGRGSGPAPAGCTIVLKSNPSLCVGAIGKSSCACCNASKLGLVACSSAGLLRWTPPAGAAGEIKSASKPGYDVNAGPPCSGPNNGPDMLLFVAQGHPNEQFTVEAADGSIRSSARTSCLVAAGPPLPPPPPPPPPAPPAPAFARMTVTWQQLGIPAGASVKVRDLWAQKDIGTFTGSFTSTIAWHEAAIFLFLGV